MGLNVWNATSLAHRSGGASDYKFNVHHGTNNVDSTSPAMTQSEWDDVVTAAAQGQSDFDSECASALGSWWNMLFITAPADRTTVKSELRSVVIDVC